VENGVVLVKTSWKNIVETFNPIKISEELQNVRTLQDAVKVDTPSIGAIYRTFGEEKVHSLLCLYLGAMVESLNVARSMNANQIELCANRILHKHKRIKMADVHVILQKAMNGQYDLFEGISGAKIMKWFDDYFSDRCDYFANQSQMDHEYKKKHGQDNEVMQVVKEQFDQDKFKLPKAKKKESRNYTLEELKKMTGYEYKETDN
jgi:hypothetical protein